MAWLFTQKKNEWHRMVEAFSNTEYDVEAVVTKSNKTLSGEGGIWGKMVLDVNSNHKYFRLRNIAQVYLHILVGRCTIVRVKLTDN